MRSEDPPYAGGTWCSKPVKPAPTIATSTSRSPSRDGPAVYSSLPSQNSSSRNLCSRHARYSPIAGWYQKPEPAVPSTGAYGEPAMAGWGASAAVSAGTHSLAQFLDREPDHLVAVLTSTVSTKPMACWDCPNWSSSLAMLWRPCRGIALSACCIWLVTVGLSWRPSRGSTRPTQTCPSWIDAHADLNTPDTSPSATFHGMVLRTLLGEGPELLNLIETPPTPGQVTLVGVRALDQAGARLHSPARRHLPVTVRGAGDRSGVHPHRPGLPRPDPLRTYAVSRS